MDSTGRRLPVESVGWSRGGGGANGALWPPLGSQTGTKGTVPARNHATPICRVSGPGIGDTLSTHNENCLQTAERYGGKTPAAKQQVRQRHIDPEDR